jgi:hypothetical protein
MCVSLLLVALVDDRTDFARFFFYSLSGSGCSGCPSSSASPYSSSSPSFRPSSWMPSASEQSCSRSRVSSLPDRLPFPLFISSSLRPRGSPSLYLNPSLSDVRSLPLCLPISFSMPPSVRLHLSLSRNTISRVALLSYQSGWISFVNTPSRQQPPSLSLRRLASNTQCLYSRAGAVLESQNGQGLWQ